MTSTSTSTSGGTRPGSGDGGWTDATFPLAFEGVTLGRWRSNRYLVLPPGFAAAAEPHRRSPRYDVGVDRLEDAWRAMAAGRPRVALRREDAAARQLEYVARSRVFRLPDVITVQLIPLGPGRSTLAVFARARFGLYDFGVNRRRVESWLARLARELPVHG